MDGSTHLVLGIVTAPSRKPQKNVPPENCASQIDINLYISRLYNKTGR